MSALYDLPPIESITHNQTHRTEDSLKMALINIIWERLNLKFKG